MSQTKEKQTIIAAGCIIGLISAALVFLGNPSNMASVSPVFCVINPVPWAFILQLPSSTSVRKSSDWCWEA